MINDTITIRNDDVWGISEKPFCCDLTKTRK